MRRLILTAFVFGVTQLGAFHAQAFDCGAAPPVANENLKAEIGAGAKLLTGRFGAANAKVVAQRTRTEIYSRYPNADLIQADRYYQYQVCQLALNSPGLTPAQRMKMVTEGRQAIYASAKTLPANKIRKQPKASSAPIPSTHFVAPAPISATSSNQTGGINAAVINGNVTQGKMGENRGKYLNALQKIYSGGSRILDTAKNSPFTEENSVVYYNATDEWFQISNKWIAENMTEAAAQNFRRIPNPTDVIVSKDILSLSEISKKKYETVLITLPMLLDNIKYLMEHDTMDPQFN